MHPEQERDERPQSYSERYRGTEWGTPETPTVAAPPTDASRILPIAVGVVLLAIAAGVGTLAFLGRGAPAPAVVTRVSLSPTAPGQTTPTDTALERFRHVIADETLPHHVAYDGIVRYRGQQLQLAGDADVSGEDMAGEFTFAYLGRSVTVDVVLLGGDAYGRPTEVEGSWEQLEDFETTTPANIFPAIRNAEVEAVGRATRGSAQLHQLRTSEWVGADPAALVGDPDVDASIERSTLNVYVDDDGAPLEALLQARIRLRARSTVNVDLEVTYAFTNVGEPVEIVAPEVD